MHKRSSRKHIYATPFLNTTWNEIRCDAYANASHLSSTTSFKTRKPQTVQVNASLGRTSVNGNRKEWADKLDDALWAFRTAYKSPIGSTPFRIVYGKACHLPMKMEHKAYWVLKNVNLDLDTAGKHRYLQLKKLAELRNEAYEHSRAYKSDGMMQRSRIRNSMKETRF
ncbi:reverse transcriptase domain-containing protein [Tanacetum coccineum]